MAEANPLLRTFKKNKLLVPLTCKVPDRDKSKRCTLEFANGCYSNGLNSYVNHEFDPFFDPSAEHLVPGNVKHVYKHRDNPKTRMEGTLPGHPNIHAINMHDPIVLDVAQGMKQMHRGTHDQWTANPPSVGVCQSMTLGQ